MTYYLGVDLGTTYTAAAVWRDGRARITYLGARSPTIPSVVLLRDDGEVLFGDAAERRAIMEPQRVAREFKRRIGDPTPLIVGGTPYSADALTAKLLRSVVDQVAADEGDAPAGIAVSHPANWGDYKQDLLRQSIRLADLDDVALVTEPEAAAIQYAGQEGVSTHEIIAVYDLGGGTFDAAVLRRTGDRWETLGEPEGIERLGGVDFDEAVFQHVASTVLPARDQSLDQLDTDDPPTVTAVAQLRRECVAAKEALTADTLASIPVYLPSAQTDVRLTRAEFENMIRPSLLDTVAALQRALRSADVKPDDVSTVLLAGGSSRIPLVAALIGEELGRPVALDPYPKHGVALGAATVAADRGPVSVGTQPAAAADGEPPEEGPGKDDDPFAAPATAASELAGGALAGLLVASDAAGGAKSAATTADREAASDDDSGSSPAAGAAADAALADDGSGSSAAIADEGAGTAAAANAGAASAVADAATGDGVAGTAADAGTGEGAAGTAAEAGDGGATTVTDEAAAGDAEPTQPADLAAAADSTTQPADAVAVANGTTQAAGAVAATADGTTQPAEATAASDAAAGQPPDAAVAADATTAPEGAVPTPPQPEAPVAAATPAPPTTAEPARRRPRPKGPKPTDPWHQRHPVGLLVGAAVAAFLLLVIGLVSLRTDGASGRRGDTDAAETPEHPTQDGGGSGRASDDDAPDDDAHTSSTTLPPGSPATITGDGATPTTDGRRTATTVETTTSTQATTTTTAPTTTTTAPTTTTTAPTTTTTPPP